MIGKKIKTFIETSYIHYFLLLWVSAMALILLLWQLLDMPQPHSKTDTVALHLPAPPSQAHTRAQSRSTEHTVVIHDGDNLTKIFNRLQLTQNDLLAVLSLGHPSQRLQQLKPGDKLHFFIDAQHQLTQLVYPLDHQKKLIIDRHDNHFHTNVKTVSYDAHTHYISGAIKNSLFADGKQAGLPEKILDQLADNFAWDVDFVKDIRAGDTFTVLYDELYDGDKKVAVGDIVAASFTTRNQTHTIVRYTDPSGHTAYYKPNGDSVRRAFLRAPLKYRRISSHFNLRRRHPILHNIIRPHKGVDYAARRGTPIYATGDGIVTYRKRKGGYGKAIILQHGAGYTTLYGHLSRYAQGLKVGSRVRQGQLIAYVGSTGLATAAHLHYEFRIHGRHRNPLKVKFPRAKPINARYKPDFLAKTKTNLAVLELYRSAQLASQTA